MGKKRSKTSKQKQARAARKSFGGISVSKGKVSKRPESQQVLLLGNKTTTTIKTKIGSSKSSRLQLVKHQTPVVKKNNDEHDDFQKQFLSMEERQNQKTAKKKKIKPSTWTMPEANLKIYDKDKSTEQLVEETTRQVQHGANLQEGGTQQNNVQPIRMRSLHMLAAQHRQQQNDRAKEYKPQNSFHALQSNDSDDDDCDGWNVDCEKKAHTPLFQFAPPSFGVDDPDL